MYQIGSSLLVLPSFMAQFAKQDAWLSVLVGICLQLAIIFLYAAISRQMNGKTIVAHFQRIFGKAIGTSLLFVFIWIVPYLIFMMTLRNLGDFMTIAVVPETPANALYLLMLIPVYYVARSGVAVIGRTSEIFFLAFVLLFMLVLLSSIPSIQLHNLMPILEFGWKPVVYTSFTVLGFPYLENFLFLFILPHYKEPHRFKKIVLTSTIISGAIFLLIIVVVTSVLSTPVMSHVLYPSYFAVRTITIADFIERFEIIVTISWYITIFYRITLLLYITAQVLTELCKLRDNRPLLIPLLLIGLIGANWVWPNLAALFQLFQIWYLYAIIFGIVLPLILWLIGKLRTSNSV